MSVESLLGHAQTLSLFKSSSLENITNAPGASIVATAANNLEPSSNHRPHVGEQKYYNLDLDLDLLVQPHLRAVTASAAQPISSIYNSYNTNGRGVDGAEDHLHAHLTSDVDTCLTDPDVLYTNDRSRDKKKRSKHQSKHSPSISPPKSPAKCQSLPNVQDQLGIYSMATNTTAPQVNYDNYPTRHVTKRRSRSTDRNYARETTEFQPLSLTLFSPTVPSSNQQRIDRRYQEGYPVSTASEASSIYPQSQVNKLLMQSPTMYTRPGRIHKPTVDSSDTESLSSFGSGSSVSDFRQALRIHHAGSTPPPLSQRLHLYPTTSAVSTNATVERLHKPVAMVTRQTQAPTPSSTTSGVNIRLSSKHSRSKRK